MERGAGRHRDLLLTSATMLWSSESVARDCAESARRYGNECIARELEVLSLRLAVAAQRLASLADIAGRSS
jgi:hypothetical protein